ncbi:MAG: hypothetical protein ACRCSP_04050, partial [Rhodoglobus sp.]
EPLDSGPGQCVLPSGAEGTQTVLSRLGPGVPVDQQEAMVEWVTALWTDAGFPPARDELPRGKGRTSIVLIYPGLDQGGGVDGVFLKFEFSERTSSVQGDTRCVPGISGDIDKDKPIATARPEPAPNVTFPPGTPFPVATPTPPPSSP